MKIKILISLSLISFMVSSKAEQVITEVHFKNNLKDHRYQLVKNDEKKIFQLILQENNNQSKTTFISKSEADFISNEATRIMWNSMYRKPGYTKKCSPYALIKSGNEEAQICAESKKTAAMTFGLLNRVAQLLSIQ